MSAKLPEWVRKLKNPRCVHGEHFCPYEAEAFLRRVLRTAELSMSNARLRVGPRGRELLRWANADEETPR